MFTVDFSKYIYYNTNGTIKNLSKGGDAAMDDFCQLKFPAKYTQLGAQELCALSGGSIEETVDAIYKLGRVFTYIGRIFTAIGTMFNSINTIYVSVENLQNYIEKNF